MIKLTYSKKFHKNLQELWHLVHRKLTTSLCTSYIYDLNNRDLKIHYFCLWVQVGEHVCDLVL